MDQAIFGALAIILVFAMTFTPPRDVLLGFATYRWPLTAVSVAALIIAYLIGANPFCTLIASFSTSLSLITLLSMIMVAKFSTRSATTQNLTALAFYPATVAITSGIAYAIAGWIAVFGSVTAGILLVAAVCIYAASKQGPVENVYPIRRTTL